MPKSHNTSRLDIDDSDINIDDVIAQVRSAVRGFQQLAQQAQAPPNALIWAAATVRAAAVLADLEAIHNAGYDHLGGVGTPTTSN